MTAGDKVAPSLFTCDVTSGPQVVEPAALFFTSRDFDVTSDCTSGMLTAPEAVKCAISVHLYRMIHLMEKVYFPGQL